MNELVAIVTGAASGIGAATAIMLARKGANVIVADINSDGAQATVDAIVEAGGKATAITFDLSDPTSIEALVASTRDRFGRIDVMVNNAAALQLMAVDANIHEASASVFNQTFGANVTGTAMACKSALNVMLAQGGGVIVNLSSVGGLAADAACPAYAASKSAIVSLTKAIATNYGKQGIRCNAVAPGVILTPAARAAITPAQLELYVRHTPSASLGEPEDVAGAVSFLASNEARFVNGAVLVVDGGMSVHLPAWADLTAG